MLRTAFAILPFLAGYYLSYFIRTVNAVIAPELTRELGLTAGDLGRLTSAYFLAFAVAQLPVGMMLDRYGPRRTETSLLLLTAAGALWFALGADAHALTLARAVMGFGVGACLMAALKYATQFFPLERQASMTGLVMAAGGLGAVTSSVPLAALLPLAGWRPVFASTAVVCVAVAVLMWKTVRESAAGLHLHSFAEQIRGLREIFGARVFWTFVPFAAFSVGGFMAIQGLWAVPWLMHVHELTRAAAARYQFVLCLAGLIGQLGIAAMATRLLRRGFSQMQLMVTGQVVAIGAQAAIVTVAGMNGWAWFLFGMAASTGAQVYSLLASRYSASLSGRVMTSINLIVFLGAFAVQWGYGEVIDALSRALGAVDAYRAAHAILIGLQVTGLLVLTIASRAGSAAEPLTPPTRGRARVGVER